MSETTPKAPPPIMPKPFNAPPKGLWRATPPAIFPPILGLFGLGLGWRNATQFFMVSDAVAETLLGAISLLYLFALLTYLAKVVRRVGTFFEDAKILPGRAGLSAMSASGFLFAAALVPYNAGLAKAVLAIALAGHAMTAFAIIRGMVRGPAEQRRVTPVWHLSFVGFIIAPLAAVPLGWVGLAQVIFATTLPMAAAIWLISALQFARNDVPPPLRPLLAIHLAPVALFGIVSSLLGYGTLAVAFGWLGLTGLIIALMSLRYLIKADFSALWGAFTFPLAALGNLMFASANAQAHDGVASFSVFPIAGALELIGATYAILYIAQKIMQLWMRGKLAKLTNAAVI